MTKTLCIKSYAKLNLYLEITGRRDDGYHLLKSVMQSISLYDTLKFTLSEGEGIEIKSNVDSIPLDRKNLIWKAVEAFYDKVDIEQNRVIVELDKKIPSMAGMAGGSSNAAAALVAMNELYGTPLTVEQLCDIGVKLGADIPFCIKGGTVLCEGIGDVMSDMPTIADCYFVVVKPDVSVSTPEAYKKFDSMKISQIPDFSAFENSLKTADIELTAKNIYNSLDIACELKEVQQIKQKLIEYGADNAMMTGSGSAVFGIFTDEKIAYKALENFNDYSFSGVFKPVNKGIEIC